MNVTQKIIIFWERFIVRFKRLLISGGRGAGEEEGDAFDQILGGRGAGEEEGHAFDRISRGCGSGEEDEDTIGEEAIVKSLSCFFVFFIILTKMRIKYPINNSIITLQFFIETLPKISINTNTSSTGNPKPMYSCFTVYISKQMLI